MDKVMTIGEKIYELRSSRNMSLREFAELTGLTHTTIARIESPSMGPQKIFLDTIYQICKKLKYSFEEFLVETGYLPAKDINSANSGYSIEEQQLVEDYRQLNIYRQQLVQNTIKAMLPANVESVQKKKGI